MDALELRKIHQPRNQLIQPYLKTQYLATQEKILSYSCLPEGHSIQSQYLQSISVISTGYPELNFPSNVALIITDATRVIELFQLFSYCLASDYYLNTHKWLINLTKNKDQLTAGNIFGYDILQPIIIADGQPLALSPPEISTPICAPREPRVGSHQLRG